MPEWRGVVLALDRGPGWSVLLLGSSLVPLIDIANRPLLEHALETLEAAGVEDLTVVLDETVAEALAGELRAPKVVVPAGSSAVAALRAAGVGVDGANVVVHHADSILGEPLELGEPPDDGAIQLTRVGGERPDGSIRRFERESGAAALGIELLTARAARDVADLPDSSVAEALATLSAPIERRLMRNAWSLEPRPESLLAGNRLALEAVSATWSPESLQRSRVEGRVTIDPSSRVEHSLVSGPVVIGPNVVLRHAYVGPYTSVASGVLIDNAEIEHSLILSGVEIRDIGWRLERSVIGPGARITRDFSLPQAVHLCVGEGARIRVS